MSNYTKYKHKCEVDNKIMGVIYNINNSSPVSPKNKKGIFKNDNICTESVISFTFSCNGSIKVTIRMYVK